MGTLYVNTRIFRGSMMRESSVNGGKDEAADVDPWARILLTIDDLEINE
jgi:hypothetical protein